MTALAWDEVGTRRFETGVDRGVLYLPEGGAVPWNGLVSIAENLGREVKSFYIDGVKYLDHQVIGAFSGRVQAYTFPEELDELTGVPEFVPGVFLHDQRSKPFSMAYRTKVGNDTDGEDHGYKIHLLYNVLATPGSITHAAIGASIVPNVFEWALAAVPQLMWGVRPTSHLSLHSRSLDSDLLAELEDTLYGSSTTDPELPNLVDLLNTVEAFYA